MNRIRLNHALLRQLLLLCAAVLLSIGVGILGYQLAHYSARYEPHDEDVRNITLRHQNLPQVSPLDRYPTESSPHQDAPQFTLPPATDGLAPVLTTIPTTDPVVYLGIDDGAFKDPSVISLLKKNHVRASLFLSDMFIASNPGFFKQIVDQGSLVESHTIGHDTQMSSKSYEYQRQEICGMADKIEQYYGRRPTLFRPPGGAYSVTMQRAAHDCGMKAIITWIAKANGGSMQYQVGESLRPGDIVLMHFRPEFANDLAAFVAAQKAAGLHTELLEGIIN